MPGVGEERQPLDGVLRDSEAAARLHQGAGGKAGSNGPGVLLLGLGYPPPQQVSLLVGRLQNNEIYVHGFRGSGTQ